MKIKICQNRTVERYGTEGTEQENKVVIMEFEFPEEIQDYVKYIEFEIDDNNKVFDLIQNDKYTLTSAITKYQEVKAQVVAKKDTDVWKSKMFELKFNKSINADHEIEDEEQIDILNTVIERVQAIEDDIAELNEKIEHISGYDDTEVRELIQQNTDSINDLDTNKQDKLIAGENITIENNVISATGGGGGTSNHSELSNLDYEHSGHTGFQPAGNYVEDNNYVHTDNNYTNAEKQKLSGLSNYDDTEIKQDIADLEANKADKSEIPDVSNFITNSVNNLLNYYLKSETYTKQEVNNLIGQVDLTGYATESWVNTQISGFLTQAQIEALITTALTGYAKTEDIPTVPTNVSAFTNDAGYLTSHQDISGKEDKTNKVTSISSSSTDTQYPSAKCVYDLVGDVESILTTLTTGGGVA